MTLYRLSNTHQDRFEFRPVKVSSLGDVSPESKPGPSQNVPMIDSAYGSLESKHGNATVRPSRQHVKNGTDVMDYEGVSWPTDLELNMPVPEHELNMEALKVPFQDFLGADMDEYGNINGRNLTEYLYG